MIPYEIPVESITLPRVGELETKGLVVVVGPNSSGKTQFLRDIYSCVIGQPRALVVAEKVVLNQPKDLGSFLECLVEHGALRKSGVAATATFETTAPHFGMGSATGDISLRDAQTLYGGIRKEITTLPLENPFYRQFGPMVSTALFLDNRLSAVSGTSSFDYTSQKASNDMQALHLNSGAREKLRREIIATFAKAIGIDSTRGGHLTLRVADLPEPSPWDWSSPEKMSKLRPIVEEGDGLRSYCAVCVALLLGTRPLCLIDEPEICLHGPQEHAIGRFIGSYGTQEENVTFVATHSSQVLRGVLETANDLQIVRLVRAGSRFVGRLVDQALIKKSLRKPASRSDVILEGIFADAVTIVEADTDRIVYSAALDSVAPPRRRDTYFAAVGGTSGIADPLRFYKSLDIPVAVIADLDVILDVPQLLRILENLTDTDRARALSQEAEKIARDIGGVDPTMSEMELSTSLKEIASKKMTWADRDDEAVIKQLRALVIAIDRKRRIKRGGPDSFSDFPGIKQRLALLIEDCATLGLFLVPVGELEHWSPELMAGASPAGKPEWANEFVRRVHERPNQAGDITRFLERIAAFHAAEAERLSR